ncbi:iron-siderophore ABC transporter substrate-binding protein [Micromonospora sp. NPDC093277]|uniref:iron-siderophore ABC transporter substrate-binding protein n=1 Tax=Micromonospora sp. NPDC093277 TaxID=3364291 RepID=UPI003809CD03
MAVRTRFRTGWIAGLLAGLVALSACSSTPTKDDAVAGSDTFEKVTIKHALGEAVISKKPQRIVALGQGSTETAIALGTVPVGIEEYAWGSDETGYLPWIHKAVVERGRELPKQFKGGTELDIETIVGLEPDLILAPWSGVTQEQYDLLKDIAPTVAYREQPWVITWEEQIEVIGRAMGQQADAAKLIEDVKGQLAKATRPEYANITFSYIYNTGPGTLGVFFPTEQRVAMVSALGLKLDPAVETLRKFEVKGTDSASIGLENADKLAGSDLIFTFYTDAKNRAEIEAQPLYKKIPAVARGSVVAPTDQPFVTGSSIINPLTVPWTIERFTPLIDEAVAKLGK